MTPRVIDVFMFRLSVDVSGLSVKARFAEARPTALTGRATHLAGIAARGQSLVN